MDWGIRGMWRKKQDWTIQEQDKMSRKGGWLEEYRQEEEWEEWDQRQTNIVEGLEGKDRKI